MLAHLVLNNEIPGVVQSNEIIQSLSSFPYMLLPVLSLLKVGGEIKSMLFVDFFPDIDWMISCVLCRENTWKRNGVDCNCMGGAVGLKAGLHLCHILAAF